jgi:hypothetical protein
MPTLLNEKLMIVLDSTQSKIKLASYEYDAEDVESCRCAMDCVGNCEGSACSPQYP